MKSRAGLILFMGRVFEVEWGGVREMADSLLAALAPICEAEGRRIEVLVPSAGLTPVKSPAISEVVLPRFGSNRILWDHWTVPNYANTRGEGVLYNIKLVLPERLRIPGFTTIHDLMYFPQPSKYAWREYLLLDSLYMRLMVRRTVRRSPLTHVVSSYTGADAKDLFPRLDPSRFRVIHHGIDVARWSRREWTEDELRQWEGLESRGIRSPFLFHSGSLSPRKNVSVLVRAFRRFRESHPEYQLVLTGGGAPTSWETGIEEAIGTLPKGSCVRLGKVSGGALPLLYQRAAFYVFPSLYEGFGMPMLEAQAAGCPVICSLATTHPEVMGNSALYFNPHSDDELLAQMEKLTFEGERARLVEAGRANLARFSWEKTAREFLDLADEVARRGARG